MRPWNAILSLLCVGAVLHWALTRRAGDLFESPCYVPVVIAAAAVVYMIVADRRDRAQARKTKTGPICESCGYERGNLPVCPECGAQYQYGREV